jgi:hypothetical protein
MTRFLLLATLGVGLVLSLTVTAYDATPDPRMGNASNGNPNAPLDLSSARSRYYKAQNRQRSRSAAITESESSKRNGGKDNRVTDVRPTP